MKKPTITCFTANIKSRIIVTLIGRAVALAITLCSFIHPALAQQAPKGNALHAGIGLFSQISANGYGTEYSPQVFLKKGRKVYYAGPLIQKRQGNLSGLQLNFTYSLTGPDAPFAYQKGYSQNIELFAFVTAAYSKGAILGKHTLMEENYVNRMACENNISGIRFKSAELYAGVGLKIQFLKNFKWINNMGIGGYTSFGYPKKMDLYYNARSLGLILKTGISYEIK